MRDSEHYLQDACELYAVALLQKHAQDLNIAAVSDFVDKEHAFHQYLRARDLGPEHLKDEPGLTYISNLERHIPAFVAELAKLWPKAKLEFVNVETEFRNLRLRGDFLIKGTPVGDLAVSLKNYRNGARRPQVCSGTYNSFILNFIFESSGVGTFDRQGGSGSFRGSNTRERDDAIISAGLEKILPAVRRLDQLNKQIRDKFIDGPQYEFFSAEEFKSECRVVGHEGAQLAGTILKQLPREVVRSRILKMTGFDGKDEILLIEPETFVDTITNKKFRDLRAQLQSKTLEIEVELKGQGLGIHFKEQSETVLTAHVPFTINKNGAWISGEPYSGKRLHRKEGVELAYGQRRPKKSRELATSVNTYIDLEPTGIFTT